jgi:hypothetical protein
MTYTSDWAASRAALVLKGIDAYADKAVADAYRADVAAALREVYRAGHEDRYRIEAEYAQGLLRKSKEWLSLQVHIRFADLDGKLSDGLCRDSLEAAEERGPGAE